MNTQSLIISLLSFFEVITSDDIAEVVAPFFFLVIFVVIIISVISNNVSKVIKSVKSENFDDEEEDPFEAGKNAQGILTQKQIVYQNNLKQRKGNNQKNAHKPHQTGVDGSDHSHVGRVETYDSIVGSLGEHNDEGCSELDGVRLIATDFLYQTDSDTEYNYDAIRKGIVMGEILNTPRFKNPFGKK